jgi:hypothetical protein
LVPDVSSRSQGRIQGCDDEAAASDQDVTRRPLQIPLEASDETLSVIVPAEAAE